MRMRIRTINGKAMTMPRGMEMVELPRKRKGFLRKAMRDRSLPERGCLENRSSETGRNAGLLGADLMLLLRTSIAIAAWVGGVYQKRQLKLYHAGCGTKTIREIRRRAPRGKN